MQNTCSPANFCASLYLLFFCLFPVNFWASPSILHVQFRPSYFYCLSEKKSFPCIYRALFRAEITTQGVCSCWAQGAMGNELQTRNMFWIKKVNISCSNIDGFMLKAFLNKSELYFLLRDWSRSLDAEPKEGSMLLMEEFELQELKLNFSVCWKKKTQSSKCQAVFLSLGLRICFQPGSNFH